MTKANAKAAGFTRVVSNGQFHREMSQLIERYATGNAQVEGDEVEGDDLDAPDASGSLPPGIDGFSAHDTHQSAPQR